MPKDDTWERSNNGLPDVLDTGQPLHCSIGAGLIGFGHEDQHHSPLRLGTSVILSGAYFVLIPEATATLGADVAAVAVGLQGAGFLILGAALLVDRVLKWPNKALAKGEAQCLVCQDCGCVAHSHGIWHVAAVLSAVLTAVGREYALDVVSLRENGRVRLCARVRPPARVGAPHVRAARRRARLPLLLLASCLLTQRLPDPLRPALRPRPDPILAGVGAPSAAAPLGPCAS